MLVPLNEQDLLGSSKPLDLFYPGLGRGPMCQHTFRVGKHLGGVGCADVGVRQTKTKEGEEQDKADPGNSQFLSLYSTEVFAVAYKTGQDFLAWCCSIWTDTFWGRR